MKNFLRLGKFIKPYWFMLLLTLIFSLIHVGAALFVPVVIGRAIDVMIGAGEVDFIAIGGYIIVLAICITAVLIFQWLSAVCANRVSFFTVRDIRNALFSKLNTVPLKYVDTVSHGDILSRVVNDSELVSDGLISGFVSVFTGIITVGGTIFFLFTISPMLGVIVVCITPLSALTAWFIAKRSHNKFKMQAAKRGELSGLSEELLSNQRLVKAFSYEDEAMERFNDINSDLNKYGVGAMFFSSISNPASRFINSVTYAAVVAVGAVTIINTPAALTVGLLTTCLFYANQYSKPFNEITSVITELQTAAASLARVGEVLDSPDQLSDAHLPELTECDGSLSAENVYFSYSPEVPLIRDFNIKVKKGQRIAIVGPTGCGKTTLINLLMRFYDATSGTIKLSEHDITTITRGSLREKYGMILQDSWLFRGTIKQNISYGKEHASDEEIIEAAKKAHIHNFIMRCENGYDTLINEDGSNISQGQKQLLCIARIMLTSPPMLILDEATSNIDTRIEKRVQKAFKLMMEGRTSFIIAHRLSTIEDADLILVMQNGNIVESGTHAGLLSKDGFYAYLFNSQFSR